MSNLLIGQAGRQVTIRDVAQEAAVSIGTVSRAMSNHARILPDIRARVLATVAPALRHPVLDCAALRIMRRFVPSCRNVSAR